MKKWLFAGFLVIASIICAGWLDRDENFNSQKVCHKVVSGDTVWGICGKYFNKQNRYKDYNEFVWNVRKDNNLLGAKFIEPGDTLYINLQNRKSLFN